MDVNSMLLGGKADAASLMDPKQQQHTRQYMAPQAHHQQYHAHDGNSHRPSRGGSSGAAGPTHPRGSPAKKDQKHVLFQLIAQDSRTQARLPMRVMINTHDTTESIITTLKNFYGIYEGYGVSLEDKEGISMIAAYDNFETDMTVYVRTVPSADDAMRNSVSPKKPTLGAPFEMRPPHQLGLGPMPSRMTARSAGVRSISPQSELGQRSASAAPGGKPRTHRTNSKDAVAGAEADGYSSGDNGDGSVASSRRSKTEQVNANISVDNIVEGGRRKRAFESSELPLFVPPQVPISASISSISPQRRNGPVSMASPYAYSNQQTFSYPQPLPSPQSYGGQYPQSGSINNGYGNMLSQAPSRQLRGRPSVSYPAARSSNGGIMPTPDPTIGSVISDEDVALQLMRLGDPTAYSHGRTSTSTVDDAFSGKAEAPSSGEESDEEDDRDSRHRVPAVPRFDAGPQRKKQRTIKTELPSDGTSGEEYEDHRDGNFHNSDDLHMHADGGHRRSSKSKSVKPRPTLGPMGEKVRSTSMAKPKTKTSIGHGQFKVPMSPSSLPTGSRKGSITSLNFQHQLGVDEEDLSSKPRCQRCRKSKKGCDRQRPCGRCKDAGLGADACVSEDEGNGRKGRYGRHMGVAVKLKGEEGYAEEQDALMGMAMGGSAIGLGIPGGAGMPANGYFLAPAGGAALGKDKKRKR